MFERFFRNKPKLAGAPAAQRMKTYSAQTGYVYEYFYEGYREDSRGGERVIEFWFRVTSGRTRDRMLRVVLAPSALAEWERANERTLSATERYALAKMALFHAFDERPAPEEMTADVHLRAADVAGFAAELGL